MFSFFFRTLTFFYVVAVNRDLDVFYQVIVPLLGRFWIFFILTCCSEIATFSEILQLTCCSILTEMDATALICISTPQDNLNFYSEMFTMKGPDGKELFRSIQVGLACAACLAAGKGDSCTHNEDEIPPWKSREKFDMIKSLYGDRKDLLLRESVGAITEDQSSLFPSHWVDYMFNNTSALPASAVRHIIVACDPNGGGDSHMAIVSCAFVRGTLHIVGLDSHPVRGHDEIESLLMAHIKQLRSRFPNCWFIFLVNQI